jgi:hypothetical protein
MALRVQRDSEPNTQTGRDTFIRCHLDRERFGFSQLGSRHQARQAAGKGKGHEPRATIPEG